MSSDLLPFLLIFTLISLLVGGIIFVSLGYRFHRNLKLITTGWIIIGAISLIFTFGAIYIGIVSYSLIVSLVFICPIFILAGLIFTLAFGISNLESGFAKPRNKTKILNGFICIGINALVITTIVVLLLLFMTGIIPIRLM